MTSTWVRRYETDPQKHIQRCSEWLHEHAIRHMDMEKGVRCRDCPMAERLADGIAHLRDALSKIERLEAALKERE